MTRTILYFLSEILRWRSPSGKAAPLLFLDAGDEDVVAVLGDDFVNVSSSDAESLASALRFTKPVRIEDLDLTPSELVDDVVRLLTSEVLVVSTVSDRGMLSAWAGGPDGDMSMEDFLSSILDPKVVPFVSPVSLSVGRAGFSPPIGPNDRRRLVVESLDSGTKAYSRCVINLRSSDGRDGDLDGLASAISGRLRGLDAKAL